MKFRKLMPFLAFAILLAMLCFCLTGTNRYSAAYDAKEAGTGPEQEDKASDVTFKIFSDNFYFTQSEWGKDLTSRKISALTGVKLEVEIPADPEDGRSRINLMMSTNQYPDLIMLSRSELSRKLVANNAVIPVDTLLQQYGTDILQNVTMDYLKKYCAENDGRIYGLPNGVKWKDEYPQYGSGILLLESVHKMLGSPEIKTTDDLYRYLAKIKNLGFQNHQGVEITPAYMDWPPSALCTSFGISLINVDGSAYVYDQDGRIHHALRDNKMKEAYRYTNQLFREALIDQDWFVQPKEEVYKKLLNGRIAVYFADDAQGFLVEYERQMEKISGDSYFLIEPPLAPGVQKNGGSYISDAQWTQVYITSQCEDPVRAMEFLNWMASEKGQYIAAIGPEETVWTMDSRGNPVLTPEFAAGLNTDRDRANREIGLMQWNFQQNYKYWKNSVFALMTPEEQKSFKECSAIIAKALWTNAVLEPLFFSSGWNAEEVNSAIDVYISRAEKQIYMAADDTTFETLYEETLAGAESLGLETLENELNTRIENQGR